MKQGFRIQEKTKTERPQARSLALVFVIAIGLHLPFLGQAFHMDDAIYLRIARHVSTDPWFPQDFPILFEGIHAPDLGSMEHPPLVPYLLAAAARLGGFREIPLHLAYLLFPSVAALSMLQLGRRFAGDPTPAALLLVTIPVFWVMTHCLMSDLALLALWTASAALFVRGVDEKRSGPILCGALAALLSRSSPMPASA